MRYLEGQAVGRSWARLWRPRWSRFTCQMPVLDVLVFDSDEAQLREWLRVGRALFV